MNFYKLWLKLEAIEHDLPTGEIQDSISDILGNVLQKLGIEDLAKFIYFCAEDSCGNILDNTLRTLVESHLKLIETYFNNLELTEDSLLAAVTQLRNIADQREGLAETPDNYYTWVVLNRELGAVRSAMYAILSTLAEYPLRIRFAVNAAEEAATSFLNITAAATKSNEYLHVATSFLSRESNKNQHTHTLNRLTDDPNQLGAVFDYIEENDLWDYIFVQDDKGIWHINFPGWQFLQHGNENREILKQQILTSQLPFFKRVREYIKQLYTGNKKIKQTTYQK